LSDQGSMEMNETPQRKSIIKHLVVSIGLLTFGLILVAGGVGVFFLNRIGWADEHLYDIGVKSLGIMAEMREEFNSCPMHVRDLIIETNADKMDFFHENFKRTKEAVTDNLRLVERMIKGDAEKERLAADLNEQLGVYWKEADGCIALCLANKKQEALQYMRRRAFPNFQASLQAMGMLQESMKADALSQVRSNRTTITSASAVMAACVLVMGLLAIVFAVRIIKLT